MVRIGLEGSYKIKFAIIQFHANLMYGNTIETGFVLAVLILLIAYLLVQLFLGLLLYFSNKFYSFLH